MASIISAGTTSGTSLNLSGDTSGVLQLATNGSTTAITVDTSQNVGIGTGSPAATLTVAHASGVDGRGIRLVNSSNSQTWENRIGVQALENTSYAIKDITAGSVRFLINTSGDVGIGTNSPNQKLQVNGNIMTANGSAANPGYNFVASSATGMFTPDGFVLGFSAAGTERMRLNSSGTLILQGGSTSATGVGITFPATQSASSDANTLDDYEEGTWTPTFSFSGSTTGITYSEQIGRYTKVGRVVTVQCYVQFLNKGSASGNWRLEGLPFTSQSGNNNYCAVAIWVNGLGSLTGGVQAFINPNQTYITIYQTQTGSAAVITNTNCNNGTDAMINATYVVA